MPEATTPNTGSIPRRERRHNRRVALSLELRIRPLGFGDTPFEEVRTTLNVSRNAIYFLTSLNSYHKGMRLLITSAHGPYVGSGKWEDTGEVTRIEHRRDGRYGVAVLLTAPSRLALSRNRP
jgi:hypothetical protein